MSQTNTPFLIAFTKQVTFRNSEGVIIGDFSVGDIITATHDTGTHFLTLHGGVSHEEARVVNGLELITYLNPGTTDRFRQYAKDRVPSWATDIRVDRGDG
jgi:hypothetical protein